MVQEQAMVQIGVVARWTGGLSDPSWMAWLIAAGYFLIGGLYVAGAARLPPGWLPQRVAGVGLGLVLMFMGLNKQLDFHDLLLDKTRALSVEQGWFRSRRYVFSLALVGAGLAMAGGTFLLHSTLKRSLHPSGVFRMAILVWAGLAGLILIRFIPLGPVSGLLKFTVFEASAEIWQFQVVELGEIFFLLILGKLGVQVSRLPR